MLNDSWSWLCEQDKFLEKKTQFNLGKNTKTCDLDHETRIFPYKANQNKLWSSISNWPKVEW